MCNRQLIFSVLLAMLWLSALSSPAAAAKETLSGHYTADVVRIIDGDTFEANVKIWLGQSIVTKVRLAGVDTPELNSPCAAERELARIAKNKLTDMLSDTSVYLHNIQPDKYGGRIVANVRTARGERITNVLLQERWARPYDGNAKPSYC